MGGAFTQPNCFASSCPFSHTVMPAAPMRAAGQPAQKAWMKRQHRYRGVIHQTHSRRKGFTMRWCRITGNSSTGACMKKHTQAHSAHAACAWSLKLQPAASCPWRPGTWDCLAINVAHPACVALAAAQGLWASGGPHGAALHRTKRRRLPRAARALPHHQVSTQPSLHPRMHGHAFSDAACWRHVHAGPEVCLHNLQNARATIPSWRGPSLNVHLLLLTVPVGWDGCVGGGWGVRTYIHAAVNLCKADCWAACSGGVPLETSPRACCWAWLMASLLRALPLPAHLPAALLCFAAYGRWTWHTCCGALA